MMRKNKELEQRKNRRKRRLKLKDLQKTARMWQDLYQTHFEECRDGLFISTPEGQLIDINPAGVALFGYSSKEEILQANLETELFGSAEQCKAFHKLIAQNESLKDFEITSKTKAGEAIIIQQNCSVVRDKNGNIVAYRGSIRDITIVRKLEEQLSHTLKRETVSGFASNFNNVLSAISGYCELMNILVPKSGQLHEYLLQVEKTVDKGAVLTRQMLSLNKNRP